MSEKIEPRQENGRCNGENMSGAAYLHDAQRWAGELVERESRGRGDSEKAMRRLEAKYGIPWRTFWALKYRPPTDIFISTYMRLRSAYVAECERQMRLLNHDLQIAKAKGLADSPVVASAEAALRDMVGHVQEHD